MMDSYMIYLFLIESVISGSYKAIKDNDLNALVDIIVFL